MRVSVKKGGEDSRAVLQKRGKKNSGCVDLWFIHCLAGYYC